ncbi:hypothetical protein [Halomarina oriensis]|uniref:Uncharacterized protein n=1 Tax=Halomarina oriensis TaxID=671145 RepID=A0A6B0GG43_9EURY|nr:hypothetical protein [Halomarina oriensis]MWG33906.1 hypothetical protein [Halomarina oriensis]
MRLPSPSLPDLVVVGTLTAFVVATGHLFVALLAAALLRQDTRRLLARHVGRGEQL